MKTDIELLVKAGMFLLLLGFNSCKKEDNTDSDFHSAWTELGGTNKSSFESTIYDVIADNDGNIYASGAVIHEIVAWNGINWRNLGDVNSSPFTGGVYWPISLDKSGNLYAVGRILVPQANSEYHVAKWEKSSNNWINLTSSGPLFDNGISSIVSDASGNVYVAGNAHFVKNPGNYIMKWNGSSWIELGGTLPSGDNIHLYVDAGGNLFAALGILNENGSPYVSKWSGSSWDELGGKDAADFGIGQIFCLCSDNEGNIYAGGFFNNNNAIHNIAKWNKASNTWSYPPTMNYSSGFIHSLVSDSVNNIYAAGEYINSDNYRYIAKYDGAIWSSYGNLEANSNIKSICFDSNGNLYAGGDFTNSSNKMYIAVLKKK